MELKSRQVTTQFLTFHVAGGEYALDILAAREIIACETITRVPATPAFVRGVVSLRDTPLPVIDLAIKLGLPATPITNAACIVVAELRVGDTATAMGIIVDAVGRVLDLAADSIRPIPALTADLRLDYLSGMTSTDTGFVLFLDLTRALASSELLDAVSPAALLQALETQACADSSASCGAASAGDLGPSKSHTTAAPQPERRRARRRRGSA